MYTLHRIQCLFCDVIGYPSVKSIILDIKYFKNSNFIKHLLERPKEDVGKELLGIDRHKKSNF